MSARASRAPEWDDWTERREPPGDAVPSHLRPVEPEARDARPAPPPRPPIRSAPAFDGLTATGAGIVGLIVAGALALLDAWISPGLGLLFAAGFVVLSGFIGLRLRGSDAWAAFAVPPLLYVAAAGIGAQVGPLTDGPWLERTSSDMATAVVGQWLVVCLATVVSVVAVAYRAYVDRGR